MKIVLMTLMIIRESLSIRYIRMWGWKSALREVVDIRGWVYHASWRADRLLSKGIWKDWDDPVYKEFPGVPRNIAAIIVILKRWA